MWLDGPAFGKRSMADRDSFAFGSFDSDADDLQWRFPSASAEAGTMPEFSPLMLPMGLMPDTRCSVLQFKREALSAHSSRIGLQ